ncbi:hypothetical protein RhiirC2_858274 [Rhizophagus irregularis]|uniref:Uncharacterized protein n=1 Tax=Rhizophagus irregularis TaxID=588596 RepID=A0A2N1M6N1_9GLOM|nr:hypothetical protein RhiirC2_858274 [Rhizophagus irregularis]
MLKTKKNVHNNRNQKEVSIHSSPKTPPNRVYTGLDKVENKIRERNTMELPVEKVAKYREGKIEDTDFAYTQYDFPTTKEHTAKLDIKIQHPMKKFEEVLCGWVHNNDKKFEIGEEIIRTAEQSDLVKKFIIPNEKFKGLE